MNLKNELLKALGEKEVLRLKVSNFNKEGGLKLFILKEGYSKKEYNNLLKHIDYEIVEVLDVYDACVWIKGEVYCLILNYETETFEQYKFIDDIPK